jgi:hypothetical protein
MSNRFINCSSLDLMLEVIGQLVPLGLTFTACADTFTITLTGGY